MLEQLINNFDEFFSVEYIVNINIIETKIKKKKSINKYLIQINILLE